MQRRKFDQIVTSIGAMLTIVFIAAGALLSWGANFATNTVHDQLAAQQIYFPPAGSDALKPAEIGPHLNKYAGQQLTTGKQAEAYADHFIAVHIKEIAGGKTYAQVSGEAMKDPSNAQLQGQVAALFKGETLRGLLLNAYAFSIFGDIARYASWAAYAAAAVMLLLVLLGWRHSSKVDPSSTL